MKNPLNDDDYDNNDDEQIDALKGAVDDLLFALKMAEGIIGAASEKGMPVHEHLTFIQKEIARFEEPS